MNTPKIRGYIAQKENIIVLLYRKTNKVTYLVHFIYDKKNEKPTLGSRFYGKFYPNRCDISEDGKHFLYFAMGQSQKKYKKKLYCWTAICTPPKIKAEILFEYNGTRGGGGRFIDKKNISIDKGMHTEFNNLKEVSFKNYKIDFNYKALNGGWDSGKNWELIEHQIDERYGGKYPIPKLWTKTNGEITLNRKLEYDTFLKEKKGKTQGAYDIYSYIIVVNKLKTELPLTTSENNCLWADFDNYGRLIVSYGSNIMIYKNNSEILNNKPSIKYNLEELITLPNTVYKT